jgi:Lrp/AsnC family leucine-responsive transcriptional regulator
MQSITTNAFQAQGRRRSQKYPHEMYDLDDVDAALVGLLQEHAREPFAKIATRINLSATSVAERVHRLEADGVILGYHADVAPARVGYPVTAFLLIQPNGPDSRFAALAQTRPEILECHRVTGHVSFIARAVLRDVKHLEEVIDYLAQSSQIVTLIVLSSTIEQRHVPVAPR